MIHRIKHWFASPIFIDDDEKTRRAEVLNTIIVVTMFLVVVLMLGNLLGGKSPPGIYLIDLLVFLTGLILRSSLQAGRLNFVGLALLALGFTFITAAIAIHGTVRTPNTAIYIFLVIIAEVLYGLRGALVLTILCSLAVLAFTLAEIFGLIPLDTHTATLTQWVTYTVVFGAIGGLSYTAHRTTQKALVRAHKEIAERKRAEEALRESDERWQFAIEGSGDGLWDWDAQTNTVFFSDQWKAMLGYAPDEIGDTLAEWDTRLHPEDREHVYTELNRHLKGETAFYSSEHRVRCKDGSYKWILDRGKVVSRSADGAALRVIGTHTDITDSKAVEVSLRESESRFRSLFEQTHDAVFILDFQGHHQAANQRAADMLGYSLEEVLQLSVREVSAELSPSLNVIDRLLAGEQVPAYERLFRKKNGQVFPVEINVELVRDKNGAPRHIQSVVTDISQRKLAEADAQTAAAALQKANELLSLRVAEVESLQAEMREQTLHDPLTGLYNRRYLSETLGREIARAERDRCPLSLIVSDIDFFKVINDTYGHLVGDRFLVEIARRMKQLTRSSDIVCRYGGEEFLLMLPHTSIESAVRRAEEIRQMCMATPIHHDGQELHISMSFGIATYPNHGLEPEEIIIKADKALYQSKHSGRNQVTVWKQPE